VIDGWAMRLLLEQVDQHYRDGTCHALVDFNGFIEHFVVRKKSLLSRESERFWTNHLASTAPEVFPPLSSERLLSSSGADSSASRDVKIPGVLTSMATSSTIIQAAWALLMARTTNTMEATYGMVLAGRNLDVPGIKRINGPTFTTVPMRVIMARQQTTQDLFAAIHQTRTAMKPHQHVGLQNIRCLGAGAARACNFQSLLVVQPKQAKNPDSLFRHRSNTSDHWARLNAYALMLQCDLTEEGFCAQASFDSRRISTREVEVLLRQFEDIVLQFSMRAADASLDAIQLLSATDEEGESSTAILGMEMEKIQSCVHTVISHAAQSRLSDLAVVSWDGELTYRELEDLSDRLACRLRQSNVGPEVMVALMFEKSLWVVVAMMAVMKAGGVFVSLDPTHPIERLVGLVQQTSAAVLLCAEKFTNTFASITSETIPVCRSVQASLPAADGAMCNVAGPENACYGKILSRVAGGNIDRH
jgi:non-ribosomal peptide synthetase component F